jgi:hypothetical protein
MVQWRAAVEPTAGQTKILVTDEDGNEVLKAALSAAPNHPRALLTLLEGLALWAGHPLTAAISVGPALPLHIDAALFGRQLVADESALVRFWPIVPLRCRRRTLSGVGDFRQLRLVWRRGA